MSPDYEGDLPPGPKGPTVSPSEDDIPVRDGNPANIDTGSDPSSNTGFGFSRISGTANIPGFTSGVSGGWSGGGGGSGGSGGSSGGGAPSVNPGGGGVI